MKILKNAGIEEHNQVARDKLLTQPIRATKGTEETLQNITGADTDQTENSLKCNRSTLGSHAVHQTSIYSVLLLAFLTHPLIITETREGNKNYQR